MKTPLRIPPCGVSGDACLRRRSLLPAALAAWGQVTGQLWLAAHPSRYLPALKGRAIDRATLLHLATCTAGGLPLQFPDTVAGEAGVLRCFQTWKPGAQPGAVRQYPNPCLGLLGLATATAMRDRFDRLIETRLLQPLGMRHTQLSVPAAELAHCAWGCRDGRPVRVSPGPLDAETYGVKSTAPDMLRWLRAHMDPTGLDRSLVEALRLTHIGRFKVGSMVQGLVQCSTLCGTSNRAFGRLASLQILAMPPGIAVVCASPDDQTHRFSSVPPSIKHCTRMGAVFASGLTRGVAGRQFGGSDLRSSAGDAGAGCGGTRRRCRTPVRQDRLHRWLRCVCRVRAGAEAGPGDAGQQELSDPRAHRGELANGAR